MLRSALATVVLAAVVAFALFHFAAGASPTLAAGPEAAPLDPGGARPSSVTVIEVPILMYHYVDAAAVPGSAGNVLTVRTKAFEQQMDFLASHGYHTVTMEHIFAALTGGAPLPSKPVALTFDDGGLDNYTVAYPILRSHGFVATFFVMTGFVGDPGTMTWSQLLEMAAVGMDIGSHTDRHADLTEVSAAVLRDELEQSRQAIEAATGHAPVAVSYPFGRYDQRVIAAATAAGYLMAVTTHEGIKFSPAEIYSLPRVHVRGTGTLKDFARSLGLAVTL
jgi:peptidoglycan/xylan/chitin deacetylase (PgdA/CDA1 family)